MMKVDNKRLTFIPNVIFDYSYANIIWVEMVEYLKFGSIYYKTSKSVGVFDWEKQHIISND